MGGMALPNLVDIRPCSVYSSVHGMMYSRTFALTLMDGRLEYSTNQEGRWTSETVEMAGHHLQSGSGYPNLPPTQDRSQYH